MARKFLTSVDLAQNELRNFVVQVLASAPGSPKEGQEYYDSTKKELGVYNGTEWKYSGTVVEATTGAVGTIELAEDLAGTATAPKVKNLHLTGDTAINHKLTEVSEPTANQDAATKAYVDSKANGLSWKQPVVVATAAALPAVAVTATTLTAEANGILEVDGVKLETIGQRVLVKNQAEGKNNGIYTLTTKGEAGAKFVLTRAADFSTEAQILDGTVFAEKGTENADHVFNCTTDPTITVGTTALTFVEIQSGTAVVGDETYTTRTGNKLEIKPTTATPGLPAEGAVTASPTKGTSRKVAAALTGDGAKTEFKISHGLTTRMVRVQGLENSAGNPTVPVELDWEANSTSEVTIKFATAPTAGVSYFVAIWG